MSAARTGTLVVGVAALIGAVLGMMTAPSAQALTTVSLEIHPAADTRLNCGWHGTCGQTPTSGVALDFKNNSSHSIYWRSYGYIAGSGYFAKGTVANASANCYRTYVNISSPADVTYRGTAMYTHTRTDVAGSYFSIYGATYGSWFAQYVGYTITGEDPDECPWDGEHLHQRGYWENVSSSSRNTSTYPGYVNYGTVFPITNQGYWQDSATWSY